jgi:hypothetical protein
LAAAQAQVGTASSALLGLTANQTFTSVNTAMTINAVNDVADVYVLDIRNLALGSGENITFNGDAGDVFVLNVTGSMAMNGDAEIVAGLPGSHVFVNITDTGSLGTVAHVGNLINGTALIPNATSVTFHSVAGAIWGGPHTTVTLMSDAIVTYQPFVPPQPLPAVPEPTTFIAGALLLLPFGASTLRILRRQATG